MHHGTTALYLIEQIHLCEKRALEEKVFTEAELMISAGLAAFEYLQAQYPMVRSIAIFCGAGKNAGDGYVLARLALEANWSVVVYPCRAIERLPGVAKEAALSAIAAGVFFQSIEEGIDPEVGLIVDALMGTGVQGVVRGEMEHAITFINESKLPILSLDVPSGLNADTGVSLGTTVKASATLTFIAPKVGLYTADAMDYCGQVVSHPLQLQSYMAAFTPSAYILDAAFFQGWLLPRRKNTHKGCYGHVLLIGGSPGMEGAIHLAARAAIRMGAGTVTVATSPECALGFICPTLEVMVHKVADTSALRPLLHKASVCVIGPGLGDSTWAQALFSAVIASQLPLVIDASALGLLAQCPQYDDNWVLTPHPGEAATLLACDSADVQQHRLDAVERIQAIYGGCIVLKGAGTLIRDTNKTTFVCTKGNPGMASAGMGDVLTGIIGGLLAQGLNLGEAATLGVWLHAKAADEAVTVQGERGLIASDLIPYLCRQLRNLGG